MDAMNRSLSIIGSVFFLAAGCVATHATAPVIDRAPRTVAADQGYELLLARLSELSDYIGRNLQSPQLWRYELAQGDVLVKLAARSKANESDNWLRMAVDSYQSAAVLSPDNDLTAHERLFQIVRNFSDRSVSTYAALEELRVDYLRMLGKDGVTAARAQQLLRDLLIHFVQDFPKAPEAPQVVFEVGQISESLGDKDNARRYYRFLAEHSPDHAVARRAGKALSQLGLAGETMHLKLPLLFAGPGVPAFDVDEVHDKVVVAYFWSSTSAQSDEDFRALKQLTDRYRDHGLEVVYVNLDTDPAQAREFLSGRLMAGVHVFQEGGLDSRLAERYGVQTLPQTFLISKDGVVIRHALKASELELDVSGACVTAVASRYR